MQSETYSGGFPPPPLQAPVDEAPPADSDAPAAHAPSGRVSTRRDTAYTCVYAFLALTAITFLTVIALIAAT